MRTKSVLAIFTTLILVFSQQGWALEQEAGDVVFPGEADYPYSTQPGWGNNGRVTPKEGQKLFMHGYGELHYNSPNGGDANADFHRFVWGISYEISENLMLHSEVDFEHGANEMELEFAYLDYSISEAFNVRAGGLLMPVGSLNEFHEPPLFYSVERPLLHKVIIPTTWQEAGIGIYGTPTKDFRYRVYVVSGLNGTNFRAKDGIRKGRGKLAGAEKQPMVGEELAVVGRFDYSPLLGISLGTSLYYGGVNQEKVNKNIPGDPTVSIYEFDARLRMYGIDFRATYAKVDIDGADRINTSRLDSNGNAAPLTGNQSVGEELVGWYVELGYHLGQVVNTNWDFVPFVRYSEVNTQDKVPTGFTAEGKNDQEILTIGVAAYPHPQVAIKIDYQDFDNAAGTGTDQLNLGVAYMF